MIMAEEKTKKWLAVLLSFIIPGVGQIFNKQWKKAIGIWIGFIIGGVIIVLSELAESDLTNALMLGVGGILIFGIWIWNLYDAYTQA